MTKNCIICGEPFHGTGKQKTHLFPYPCSDDLKRRRRKITCERWHRNNRERVKINAKIWRGKNQEKVRLYSRLNGRRYYRKHLEVIGLGFRRQNCRICGAIFWAAGKRRITCLSTECRAVSEKQSATLYKSKGTSQLSNEYVSKVLKLPQKHLPIGLIAAKREHIKLRRLIKSQTK